MAPKKFWTTRDGVVGTAHLGRDGSEKDFRPASWVSALITQVTAEPPEGVIEVDRLTVPATTREVSRVVSEDGLRETVTTETSFMVNGQKGVIRKETTSLTPLGKSRDEEARAEARAKDIANKAHRKAEEIARLGDDFPAWLERRLASPLKGVPGRTIGRAHRGDGRWEAACAVVEGWLEAEPLPGKGEYRFLTQVVEAAGGAERVLGAVTTGRRGGKDAPEPTPEEEVEILRQFVRDARLRLVNPNFTEDALHVLATQVGLKCSDPKGRKEQFLGRLPDGINLHRAALEAKLTVNGRSFTTAELSGLAPEKLERLIEDMSFEWGRVGLDAEQAGYLIGRERWSVLKNPAMTHDLALRAAGLIRMDHRLPVSLLRECPALLSEEKERLDCLLKAIDEKAVRREIAERRSTIARLETEIAELQTKLG